MIRITRETAEAMNIHAMRDCPRECCGVLAARGGVIVRHYPLRNEAQDPKRRYFAAPADLFEAMRTMRMNGERLAGIYHSHPRGPAHPSSIDIELSFYPDTIHFILAPIQNEGEPSGLFAFHISAAGYRPAEFKIEEETLIHQEVHARGA